MYSLVRNYSEGGVDSMAQYDILQAWSIEKLKLLEQYLAAYTSILHKFREKTYGAAKWPASIDYVDAFAGSVTPTEKGTEKYLDGSPLVALKTSPPFERFIFIEKDQKKFKSRLEPLKDEYIGREIDTRCGDCNDVIRNDIVPFYEKNSKCRAFAFLDPYGLQLKWNTVESLGKTKAFDVFINFSLMGVYRLLPSSLPNDKERRILNSVLGNETWFERVYPESRQLSLLEFDAPKRERQKEKLIEILCDIYRKQLKTCFEHVSRPVIMLGPTNSPLYAMILASQKKLAVDKMHEIYDRQEKKRMARRNT